MINEETYNNIYEKYMAHGKSFWKTLTEHRKDLESINEEIEETQKHINELALPVACFDEYKENKETCKVLTEKVADLQEYHDTKALSYRSLREKDSENKAMLKCMQEYDKKMVEDIIKFLQELRENAKLYETMLDKYNSCGFYHFYRDQKSWSVYTIDYELKKIKGEIKKWQ